MARLTEVIIPYTPRYPEVHKTLESRRFVVLVAHRRFGKTVLAVNHLLKKACLCTRERGSYAYVAPFRNQAKEIAWSYFKHYSASIPGRSVNESGLSILLPNQARIRLFGADNPDALRGLYFDGVVLDEVAQMKPEVWGEIIQPALADRQGEAVFIGTPKGVNLFSELYERACKLEAENDKNWAALCFRVDETNALPSEEVARLRRELSDNAWRQEMLCDFTAAADDALISIDLVSEASTRIVTPKDVSGMPVIIGVDVARFGSDSTVFIRRQGLAADTPRVMLGLDTIEVAGRLAAYMDEVNADAVFIDAGAGAGVIDYMRKLGRDVIEAPFGARANSKLFVNKRAEMWTGMRDWLRAGGSIPNDTALKTDLCAPRYEYDTAGRIKLESKDDLKERLGRSPDRADALALTFYAPVPLREHARYSDTAVTDYDITRWR